MQSLDAAFKEDVNDTLCMLCFTDDGTVQWSTALGQIPTAFVQRVVHVFRASCSISEAFSKGFGEDIVNENSSGQGGQREGASDDAVLVGCEKDMIIVGKRVCGNSSQWFALVGKPFTLDYGRHCREMLHTLERLADVLFPGADGDSQDNLHELCDSICEQLRSMPFWSWNDKRRVTHFMGSLLTFSNTQIATSKENSDPEEYHAQSSSASARQTLSRSLESFQSDISDTCGGSHSRLLVFSDDCKPLLAQNFSPEEKQILMWYYSTCLTSRVRGFHSFFSDRSDCGVLCLWYRRRGLILFTNFVLDKAPAENTLRQLQSSAEALVDAVHVLNT